MSAKKACLGLDVLRALVVRCAFLVHMLFIIWAASCVTGKAEVWIISVLTGLLVIEAVHSVVKRRGREPKWFSPCIFVYLLAVIPPIWILNIDMIRCKATENVNKTSCSGLRTDSYVCSLVKIENIFDRKPMVYTLEEIMLLLLIVGKWLLPRGSMTLDEHSQLLMIYFGFSFDILDLFTLFDEEAIIKRPEMIYVILVIFTLSLFQFTIVFTVVRRRRPKLNPTDEVNPCIEGLNRCCMSELWSLTSHILLHDGPYMVLRLHCLIGLKIMSYNLIFFCVKNILIVVLEIYRFFVLILKCQEATTEDDDKTIDASVNSIPRQLSESSKDNLDRSYGVNGSVYGRSYSNGSFGNVYPQPRPEFNRSKQSLNTTGMNSQEINFETNV